MAFRPASRQGTKALIGLYGGSGSGKTFSALKLARGIVGPDGIVLMGDTESGRGEMYVGADGIGQYDVDPIEAPYSSNRYSALIREASEVAKSIGKPVCLVIDSMSHEWEGVGGVVSAAEKIAADRAARYKKDWDGNVNFGDWKTPKQDHKRMVLAMLGAPIHIIVCLRAKYASRQIDRKDFEKFGIPSNTRGNSVVIKDDHQSPIQDSDFIYEMTVHAELRNDAPGVPHITKCPDMLLSAFPQGRQIDNETGRKVAAFFASNDDTGDTMPDASGGESPEVDAAALIGAAKATARMGTEEYRLWFAGDDKRRDEYPGLSKESRHVLTTHTEADPDDFNQEKTVHEICKAIAAKADAEQP